MFRSVIKVVIPRWYVKVQERKWQKVGEMEKIAIGKLSKLQFSPTFFYVEDEVSSR
jgi:hypothetical protein